jgi:hypothetical protein
MVGGWLRRRRGRRSRTTNDDDQQQAAQQGDDVQKQAAQQDDDAQQQDDDSAQQDASGSGTSGSRSVYLRGPTSLPQRPILRDRRPLIRPDGERHVTLCYYSYYVFCRVPPKALGKEPDKGTRWWILCRVQKGRHSVKVT